MSLTPLQRRAASLLADGVPGAVVARQPGMPDVRTLRRWKAIPEFQQAATAADAPDAEVTADTPVEQLRALAKSPREDIALRASSKLADLEAKAAIEQAANSRLPGLTLHVTAFSFDPDGPPPDVQEVSIISDLEPGAPERVEIHREAHPKPLAPRMPSDPVRY
jgi:hypothetical protein